MVTSASAVESIMPPAALRSPAELAGAANPHNAARTRRVSAAGLAPTSGEIVTQIQLGGSTTDSLVRILHAQPGSRSARAPLRPVIRPISPIVVWGPRLRTRSARARKSMRGSEPSSVGFQPGKRCAPRRRFSPRNPSSSFACDAPPPRRRVFRIFVIGVVFAAGAERGLEAPGSRLRLAWRWPRPTPQSNTSHQPQSGSCPHRSLAGALSSTPQTRWCSGQRKLTFRHSINT